MRKIFIPILAISLFQLVTSCRSGETTEEEQVVVVSVRATALIQGDIENTLSFNGSTEYLKRDMVSSPISGYIVKANVIFGQQVSKDDILFEVQTRESRALASANAGSSPEFGNLKVTAPSSGFINELYYNEPGGFVSEGSTLCNIVDNKDIVIRLNIPFEYNTIMAAGKRCLIRLSDNSSISGTIIRILPVVDEVNQTQTVYVKPETGRPLPEKLNLSVSFVNQRHSRTLLVKKSSLMTNETQDEFWVMKIVNGDIAMMVPVIKGIENDSLAEVISDALKVNDMIISEGAYALPDSSQITLLK